MTMRPGGVETGTLVTGREANSARITSAVTLRIQKHKVRLGALERKGFLKKCGGIVMPEPGVIALRSAVAAAVVKAEANRQGPVAV